MVSYGIVWYSTHSQTSKQAPNIRSLYILPLHLQASKQVDSNRKGLEPPPHTHNPASKHPTSEVCIYSFSFPDQQASSQQQERFRAAPSHSQTSKQAPNIRSLCILPLHFQTNKQESSNRKSLEPPPHTHIEYIQYNTAQPSTVECSTIQYSVV